MRAHHGCDRRPRPAATGEPFLCLALRGAGGRNASRKTPEVYDETSTYTHVLDSLRYFFVNQSVGQQEWPDINYDDLPTPFSQF
jgi:hypothetical protein